MPEIRDAFEALEAVGLPDVTLVTDITGSQLPAYKDIDNTKAGRTAAYLLANDLPQGRGTILAPRSEEEFQGEAERYVHFSKTPLSLRPRYDIIKILGVACCLV